MRKIVLSILTILLLSFSLTAQNQRVSGTVTDNDGPVIGANVILKGTTTAAVTGIDGTYSISVPANGTLVFSYLGYDQQEVPVSGRTVINIKMQQSSEVLEEVVVLAFSSKKKEDIVGSVTQVKGAVIENSQSASVSRALEGAVPGLQVFSGTGQPGSDASIVIRGVGSRSAGNGALIIVDGMPFNGTLSDISSSDIESMTVSKDAVSNSLYGARAANGVILITTKKGRSATPRINVKASWGINQRGVPEYDLVTDQAEFYEMAWYGIRNSAWAIGASISEANQEASSTLLQQMGYYNSFKNIGEDYLVGTNGKLNPYAQERYNDPFSKSLFNNNALRQSYEISASGKSDNTDYYISLSYLDEDSYALGSSYNRFTTRVNLNSQLRKWLRVGTNISYSRTDSNGVLDSSGSANNPFEVARGWAPIYPVWARDAAGNRISDGKGGYLYDVGTGQTVGTESRPAGTNSNVVASLKEDIRNTIYNNVSMRNYLEIPFLNDFVFSFNYGQDLSFRNSTTYYTPTVGDGQTFNGRGTKSFYDYNTINVNEMLTWNKMFGDDKNRHSLELALGHETYQYSVDYMSGQKINFFDLTNPSLNNGGEIQALAGGSASTATQGAFLKGDYNYNSKYYVSGAIRREGNSKFHPDSRWGTFWSIGGSWRVTAENFMQDSKDWLNDLRLRASYGTQGNDAGLNWAAYQDQWSVNWDGNKMSLLDSYYGSKDLTWESQNTFDVGVEFSMFGSRFHGSIDYFYRVTDDMLFQITEPATNPQGRAYKWANVGKMSNQGVELSLSYDIFKSREHRGLNWTISLVGSHYQNKVLKLPDEYPDGFVSGMQKVVEGKDMYRWYTRKYAGIDKENGKPMWYRDILDSEDKVIGTEKVYEYSNATEYHLEKSGLADFTGGFNTMFSYKGFDLAIQTSFQIGGWAYDSSYSGTLSTGLFYVSKHKDLWDTWNPETKTGSLPLWNANETTNTINQSSDYFLTTASYFSIRNITLGYTLPENITNKFGIQGLRIYVKADNVWLASARKGFDPRISISGVQSSYGGYSQIRTISAGLDFNF